MRIRKQAKQALSLIFSTLIAVFSFALLLVTIMDLQTDSTPQLVSDAQPQPEEIAPQPPAASEQEHTYQEPPVEEPAAPAPAVEDDSTQREEAPKVFPIKKAFIIIGLTVLVAAIVAGVVLFIRYLTRRRLYIYEDEDDTPVAEDVAEREKWERNISKPIPYAATKDEGAKPDIHENISSSFEHEDSGESGIDYADIPRLFSK